MRMDKALFKALIKGFLSYVPGAVLVPRREGGGANCTLLCIQFGCGILFLPVKME